MNKRFLIVSVLFVIGITACKKEEQFVLPDEQEEVTPSNFVSISGDSWVNIHPNPSKRAQALATIDGKLLFTNLSGDFLSATSVNGVNFVYHNQGMSSFGNGSGIEKMVYTEGNWFGVGDIGNYGAVIYDSTHEIVPWGSAAYVFTNAYSYVEHNGAKFIGTGIAPYIRSTEVGYWLQVGDDLDGAVQSLLVYDDAVIAGGIFNNSGSTPMNHIAKWNGTNWEQLGSGLNGTVHDMVIYDGKLVACGNFSQSGNGNTACQNIAIWDGNSWEGLGSGLTGSYGGALKMLVNGNELIIGGDFDYAGSVLSPNIIKWDGSAYQALGGGLNDPIGAMTFFKGHLYVANHYELSNSNFVKKLY